jgi:hypothetical protein
MLSTIRLTGWRSHHDTTLALRRVNFFMGKPGSGKSSVPDAIVTLLIGRNRYTDARGVGIKEDITVGKGVSTIVADFGTLKATREISAKASQRLTFENAPTNIAAAQEVLLRQLKANPETILALLNPKNILECDESEQAQIMLRLMRPPSIEVPEACSAVNIAEINSTADIDSHIKRIKDVTIRDLNREVAELEEAIRNTPAEFPDVAKVRNELASVQGLHNKNIEAQTLRRRYESDLESARKNLNMLNDGSISKGRPMADILADIDKSESAYKLSENQLSEARKLRETAAKEKSEAHEAASTAGSQADTVAGMGKQCGVVAEFECPLTTRDKGRMATILKSRVAQHQSKVETMQSNLDAIDKNIAVITKERQGIADILNRLESERRQAKAAQEKEADVAAAQAELDKLLAAPVVGVSPEEVQASQDRITALQTTIAQADTARQAVAQRSIKVAQVDAKRQAIEMQQAAVASLVALKADILKRGGDVFMGEMKAILDKFGLTGVDFVASPYSLRVNGVNARRLSSGQKLVFDAALRVAAAKATGFGLFAVDDSNRLDDPNRSAIQEMLGASGCQVIVCRTIDKAPAPEALAKLPVDCAVIWFEAASMTGPTTVTVAH